MEINTQETYFSKMFSWLKGPPETFIKIVHFSKNGS
jgi:hypothetical protein